MSKLAAVAERLAQTRRWLDQEADRLAARLDQLERRAPAAIQNAHKLLDEQQKEVEAMEQMIQQWINASLDVSGGANKARSQPHAATSPFPRPSRLTSEGAASPYEPANHFLDEQQKDVGRLERALQTLASEVPESHGEDAGQSGRVQPKKPDAGALDSRRLLDESHKDEGGLEHALQTLANKQQVSAGQLARPRLKQPNEDASKPADPARRADEPKKSEDATKLTPRKLGEIRAA